MFDEWFDRACESGLIELVDGDVMMVAGLVGRFLAELAGKVVIPGEFEDRLKQKAPVFEEALAAFQGSPSEGEELGLVELIELGDRILESLEQELA